MDGKNSSGRRISLLNDNAEAPSISPLGSRTYSYASTTSSTSSPIGSPPTPQLVRSDSSDSTTMGTPSPVTPEFNFDSLPHAQNMASPMFAPTNFFSTQKDFSAYPSITQNSGPLPYHPHPTNAAQAAYFRPQQERTESQSTSASANPRSKKNSYPCPMAKQFNCNDYFTTSGHAARHAKKHTGKKDAFCPECNKAFTRKDNMEQHRRTHQSGRNAAKGTDNSVKKAKTTQTKRPKPAPIQSSIPSLSSLSSLPMVDPTLPVSPSGSTYSIAPAVQPLDTYSAYPDPTAFSMTHSYSVGSSYGLDALAIAASGEKRKHEA